MKKLMMCWMTVLAVAGLCAYGLADPLVTDGLYAYYDMEDNDAEDPNVYDSSGNDRHGILSGAGGAEPTAPHSTTGVLGGNALQFDGADDVVLIESGVLPDHMSVSLWFRPNHDYVTGRGDTAYPPAAFDEFDFFSAGWGRDAFRVHQDINFQGKVNSRIEADASSQFYTASSITGGNWVAGTWYHLAATYDGCELKLYIDGVRQATVATPDGGPCSSLQDSWTNMSVGAGVNILAKTASYAAPAAIDEVYVFDRALTYAEIAILGDVSLVWDCDRIQFDGLGIAEDFDSDCYIQINDFAVVADGWGKCSDPNGDECEQTALLEEPPLQIPKRSVTVDGDLGEWYTDGAQLWMTLPIYADYGSGVDVDIEEGTIQYAVRWDTVTDPSFGTVSRAYAAVIVPDAYRFLVKPALSGWNFSDRLEIYCQGDNDVGTEASPASYSADVCDIAQQYVIGPDGEVADPCVWTGTMWGALGNGAYLDGLGTGLEYACAVVGNVITYEVGAILFDNLGVISGSTVVSDVEIGDMIRFDLAVGSRYSDNPAIDYGVWVTTTDTKKWRHPIQMLEWELIDDDAYTGLCGEWGIFAPDLNEDCYVDLQDLAQVTNKWLHCYDGTDPSCEFTPPE